jgi:hypothetical protein
MSERSVHFILLGLGVLVCCPASASAQRFIIIPHYGWGERAIYLSELPPDSRALVRRELHCEPQAAFIFWRFFIFRDGFDFWTSNGRFALCDDEQYWEVPRETMEKLLGKEFAPRLQVPWRYWFPPGLATAIVFVGFMAWLVHRQKRRGKRFELLKADRRYQEALKVYADQVLSNPAPSLSQRQDAISTAINHLVGMGISPRRARTSFTLLISTIECQQADQLRDEAYGLAMEGSWDAAASHYQQAAAILKPWNAKAAQFLEGRVDWCQRELLRTSRQNPSADISTDE